MADAKTQNAKTAEAGATAGGGGGGAAAAAGGSAGPSTNAKALGMVKEADAKLAEWTFFASSKTANQEAAVELYDKAAAQFKLSKDWEDAAKSYVKAAETSEKFLKAETEASNYYLNAAKAYKNAGSKEANKLYKQVVAMHMENNRFSAAAKIYKEIAECEEKENSIPAAIAAWEQAADCHFAEDQASSGNQCLLKVAHYAALREDYKKSIDIYEKVSAASLTNQLMQYSVKEYMFKALLCHFVMRSRLNDIGPVSETNDKYKAMNSGWDGSRECKLIENLVKAYEAGDVTKFVDHIFSYDRISKLDGWTSDLLLKIKTQLKLSSVAVDAATVKFTTTTGSPHADPNMQDSDGSAAAKPKPTEPAEADMT